MDSARISTSKRREPWDITWIRRCFKHWPFPRGKGMLMRLFRPRLRGRDFLMEVEEGVLAQADLDDYMIYWCFTGEHEKDASFQLSLSLIRAGDTVLDVGGNVGLWVMGAARRAGPAGEVHTFEPVPDNFARLLGNLELNGLNWVRCHQLALSDREGEAVFYANTRGNSGGGSLARRDGIDKPIGVRLMTLDHFCEEQGIRHADFMKADVEGAELLVFRGAARLLAAPDAPAIMFEMIDVHAASFDSSAEDVWALLKRYGYDVFRFDGSKLVPASAGRGAVHGDFFALKPYHFVRLPALGALRA